MLKTDNDTDHIERKADKGQILMVCFTSKLE